MKMGDLNAHSKDGSGGLEPLRLAAKLDLRASLELAEALRTRRGTDLAIDASAVEHLGAHAVQTLLVAANSWARDGNHLALDHLPDAATGQLSVLGIDPAQLSSGGTA